MGDQRRESAAPVERYFDRTPQPFGDGPVDPLVYNASPRALRQRTVNFAAKRLVDMRYLSGLDRATMVASSWARRRASASIHRRSPVSRQSPGAPGRMAPVPPADVARALDGFFARSTGAYGVLIATPERILCERYSEFGAADRATPSWSMTKAITCTVTRGRGIMSDRFGA
jgi:hypothetical protein